MRDAFYCDQKIIFDLNHRIRGKTEKKSIDADIQALQDELGRKLGLPVEFRCKANGSGELRIHYSRPQELDGVLTRLRGRA